MLQLTRLFASSLAVLIVAGAIAPASAHALSNDVPVQMVRINAQKEGKQVTFQLYNKGDAVQRVKVVDTTYTLKPHATLKMTVPAGAQVYAASDSSKYHSGDLLITVIPELKGTTISID